MRATLGDFLNDNVIKDSDYESYKDFIFCPICKNIIHLPLMCMSCQNTFCKKCIEKWDIEHPYKCIFRCQFPDYKYCVNVGNMLSKLKFKCSECFEIVNYGQIEKHFLSKCNTIDIKNNINANLSSNDGIFRKIHIQKRGNKKNNIEQLNMKCK